MGIPIEPGGIAFTCVCDEPEGSILRTVRHFEFNQENLDKLWNKISMFPSFMGSEIRTYTDMIKYFTTIDSGNRVIPKGLCLVVDDFVGIFWMTDIKQLHEASVHYTFFDKRNRGRINLCKKALEFAFRHFHFHRLWTQAPVPAAYVNKFIQALGFIKFGTARRNTFFKGRFYDTNMYDVLKEEFLKMENG